MKSKPVLSFLRTAVTTALLVLCSSSSNASTNWTVFPFDAEGEFTNDICAIRLWNSWNCDKSFVPSWTAVPTNQFDPTLDSEGNAASGSLKTYFNWPGSGFQQGWNFAHMTISNGPVNAARDFSYIAIDVRIDPSSPTNASGNYGEFLLASVSLRTNEGGTISDVWADVVRLNPSVSSVGQWVTYQGVPRADQTNVAAFFIGMQGNDFNTTTPVILNYDNIRFVTPQEPPPVMAIEKAGPGLEFVPAPTSANSNAGPFVLNVASGQIGTPILSWMSYSDSGTATPVPVTYNLGISEYPDRAHSNFVARMVFAPYNTTPEGWRNHPEVDLANVLQVAITNNADGTSTGVLIMKTNAPATNDGWQTLATVTSPTAVGNWSLTCSNTQLTLRAPNLATANASLTEDMLFLIADPAAVVGPMCVWLGVQPKQANNFNQRAVFSHFRVSYADSLTGNTIITDENWTTNYTAYWIDASDSTGVNPRPTDTILRLNWLGPAGGYSLLQNTNVTSATWTPSAIPIQSSNDRKVTFIPKSGTPSTESTYYRLFNPNP